MKHQSDPDFQASMAWLMKQINTDHNTGAIVIIVNEDKLEWRLFGELDFADIAYAGALLTAEAVSTDD